MEGVLIFALVATILWLFLRKSRQGLKTDTTEIPSVLEMIYDSISRTDSINYRIMKEFEDKISNMTSLQKRQTSLRPDIVDYDLVGKILSFKARVVDVSYDLTLTLAVDGGGVANGKIKPRYSNLFEKNMIVDVRARVKYLWKEEETLTSNSDNDRTNIYYKLVLDNCMVNDVVLLELQFGYRVSRVN